MESATHAAHRVRQKVEAEAAEVPEATREKVIDMLLDGQNVGEVCHALSLDRRVVCEIINDDIDRALAGMSRLLEAVHLQ